MPRDDRPVLASLPSPPSLGLEQSELFFLFVGGDKVLRMGGQALQMELFPGSETDVSATFGMSILPLMMYPSEHSGTTKNYVGLLYSCLA